MLKTTLNPTIIPSTEPLKVGDLFAVYGTLRKGCGNYRNLGLDVRAEFVGEDLVEGTLYHLGGFPGLTQEIQPCLKDEDTTPVHVELYRVLDDTLPPRLDGLEGYRIGSPENSMYIRAKVDLIVNQGQTAEIYYYNANDMPSERIIWSGDWLKQ